MDARNKLVAAADAELGPGTVVAGGGYLVLQAHHCSRLAVARANAGRLLVAVWDEPGLALLRPAASRAHLVAAVGAVDGVFVCSRAQWRELKDAASGAEFAEIETAADRDLVAEVLAKQPAASES